ncbi:MAG: HAMP domain-containing sensor histidine kinase [Oscillospiraceae bacterium]
MLLLLVRTGALPTQDYDPRSGYLLIGLMILFSTLMGAVLTVFSSTLITRPVNTLIGGMNRLASGDYKTRIRFAPILARQPVVADLTDSFNTMAAELEGTEMLRSDFINNFSHEFKTPIVSIAGFAKLLRYGDLSGPERDEYLAIIEDESMRLSDMATNVLNMTKIENQTILSGVTRFNLSEQLRNCVLRQAQMDREIARARP